MPVESGRKKLSTAQWRTLELLYKVWRLDNASWLSFWPYKKRNLGTVGGGHQASIQVLCRKKLAKLNHFIGYQITDLGRAVLNGGDKEA